MTTQTETVFQTDNNKDPMNQNGEMNFGSSGIQNTMGQGIPIEGNLPNVIPGQQIDLMSHQIVNESGGNVMSVGPGVGDEAVDATYSTKPNQNYILNNQIPMQMNTEFLNQGGSVMGQNGLIMGVDSNLGDSAADVTYSTKTNGMQTKIGLGGMTTSNIGIN